MRSIGCCFSAHSMALACANHLHDAQSGTMVLFAYMAYSLRNVTVEVSDEGLRIIGDIYGRRIAATDLVAGEARRIDFGQDPGRRLNRRTNGIGLPGYRSGWFRLKNGEKSLVFITDTQRVVYIPTRLGYSVLLSVAEPEEFVRALGRAAR